jgi:hypothetical protein
VPVEFVVFGKFAQTDFPEVAAAVPFETPTFQFVDTRHSHMRFLSLHVQLVVLPLVCDPCSQLGVFALHPRNIAVSLESAVDSKLTQTDFPKKAAYPLISPVPGHGRASSMIYFLLRETCTVRALVSDPPTV